MKINETSGGASAWSAFRWGKIAAVGNAVLFVLLVALVAWQAPERLADRTHDARQNVAPVGPPTYRVQLVARGAASMIDIRFTEPVVPATRVGDFVEKSLVRLDPDVPLRTWWATSSRLRISPLEPLPRGRRIHVHLDEKALCAPAESGEELPQERERSEPRRFERIERPEITWIETPPIRVLWALAADHDESGTARAVLLSCDLDAELQAIKRALTVCRIAENGENGAPLDVRIEPVDAGGGDEHVWRLVLLDADLPDAVALQVDGTLVSTGAEIPAGRAWEQTVTLRSELLVTSVQQYADGLAAKFNHEIPLPAEGTLTIEPAVAFQVHRRSSGIRLYGEFQAGRAYRVTFHEGFPGSGPVRLRTTTERSLRLPDLSPDIEFSDRGSVLSSVARHEIGVGCVNVRRLEVAVRKVFANNVIRLLQDRYSSDFVCGPWQREEIAVAAPRNERTTERISLEALLGGADGARGPGLHQVRIRDLDDGARAEQRLIQITDLGATVRATTDATAVRVTSIAHARPIEGAEVRIRTPTNQVLCTATTATDGTAILRYGDHGDDREPFLIEVQHGADHTFVDLDGFEVALAEDSQAGRPYLSNGFECLVHPDRGAVRPGETARVTIVGRSARGVSPVGAVVEARWFGPDRGLRHTERMTFEDGGLLAATFEIDTSEATGRWRVDVVDSRSEAVVGSAPFLVEAFVPDRIEASVELLGTPQIGSSVRMRVRGNWLEGAPASGQQFRASVRLDHTEWAPEGWESHSFGIVHEGTAAAPPGRTDVVKGVLDEDGDVEVALGLPKARDAGPQAYQATVQVEVMDPSGRPIRAGGRTVALSAGPYLGARAQGGRLDIVLVDADGKPHAGEIPVRVSLERRHWSWRSATRYTRSNRVRRVWEPYVDATPVQRLAATIVDGRAGVEIPEQPHGKGWVVAVVHADIAGDQRRVDAPLGGEVPRPDRLRIEGPDGPVQPGAQIELTVASPTAGTAFVTFETTTVHAVRTAEVARGHDTISVTVPEDLDGPNVHVVVTIVAPQARADAAPPYWIVGATSLAIERGERDTDVSLVVPEVVLPESDVEILVDAPGATVATVALVDEGVLRVTRHADPDPRAYFGARRRLESRGADTGARLLERPGFDPDVLDGGDEHSQASLGAQLDAATSAVIENVVLFQGPVQLDPEGRARVRFSLPPYEGRLRAVVVASGPSRVGAASAPIIVRAPVGLRIAAPRRLTPGDVSVATVTLRNSTGAAATFDIRVSVGDGLELREPDVQRLQLADGESTSYDVKLAATHAAEAPAITVVASIDAEEQRTVRAAVPVAPAGLFETARVGVNLTADAELKIPGQWARDSRVATLTVDPGVGADLLPALQSLLGYPHGCVEQTSSRAHAVLACRPLLEELAPEASESTNDMIVQGIARLRAMQTPRGGMAFWIGGRTETEFGSLVALDFLLDARDQGFEVDAASLRKLVKRMEYRLANREDLSFRAIAVEVLSRAGVAVTPWLAELAQSATQPEDRARIALAYARCGDLAAARELLTPSTRTGTDDTTPEDDLLFSPTRERAMWLRAFLEVAPKDERIEALADALRADALAPDRLTTQSQSQAVRALSALHLRNLGARQPVRGSVFVDGVEHAVDGRTVITIPANAVGDIRCALNHSAQALLEVRGIRVDDAPTDTSGALRVVRSLIDVETGEAPTAVRRGGVYDVVLEVNAAQRTRNLLVTDLLPAGLEAEAPRYLAGTVRAKDVKTPDHVDVRDDRVLLHIDGPVSGAFQLRYRTHATFPGRYAAPAPVIEALYEPGSAVRGRAASDGLEIVH